MPDKKLTPKQRALLNTIFQRERAFNHLSEYQVGSAVLRVMRNLRKLGYIETAITNGSRRALIVTPAGRFALGVDIPAIPQRTEPDTLTTNERADVEYLREHTTCDNSQYSFDDIRRLIAIIDRLTLKGQ